MSFIDGKILMKRKQKKVICTTVCSAKPHFSDSLRIIYNYVYELVEVKQRKGKYVFRNLI